jgi:hypothetical protein
MSRRPSRLCDASWPDAACSAWMARRCSALILDPGPWSFRRRPKAALPVLGCCPTGVEDDVGAGLAVLDLVGVLSGVPLTLKAPSARLKARLYRATGGR